MKKIFLYLLMLAAYSSQATTYTFSGGVPYSWTYAAGWSPSYPGMTINFGDTVMLAGGDRIHIENGTTITMNGVLQISTYDVYYNWIFIKGNGKLIVGQSGKLLNRNYLFMENTAKMEIYGEVEVKDGQWQTIYMQDSSEILVHPGGQLFIEDSIHNGYAGSAATHLIVNGTVVNDGTIYNNGTINGTGSIITGNNQLNGNIVGAGYVAPGLSPGELKTDFDLTLPASGNLNIEIGGIIPGTTYDVLGGTGDKILGGTLNVSLYNGFTPQIGDEYTIISGGQVNGTFSTINYPPLPNNMSWQIFYNAADVKLKIVVVSGLNEYSIDAITLYPNPVNDKLHIAGLKQGSYSFKIYSMLGTLLQSGELKQDGTIDLNFSNSSLNLIEILDKDHNKTVRTFSKIE